MHYIKSVIVVIWRGWRLRSVIDIDVILQFV